MSKLALANQLTSALTIAIQSRDLKSADSIFSLLKDIVESEPEPDIFDELTEHFDDTNQYRVGHTFPKGTPWGELEISGAAYFSAEGTGDFIWTFTSGVWKTYKKEKDPMEIATDTIGFPKTIIGLS